MCESAAFAVNVGTFLFIKKFGGFKYLFIFVVTNSRKKIDNKERY